MKNLNIALIKRSMMLSALTAITALTAKADIITCSFTEPFIQTVYSMSKGTLTYKNGPANSVSAPKNISFQSKDAGVFELIDKNKKVIQTLKLNFAGSDGMSDVVYPYDVKDNSEYLSSSPGVGGCVSNFLKSKEPKLK